MYLFESSLKKREYQNLRYNDMQLEKQEKSRLIVLNY